MRPTLPRSQLPTTRRRGTVAEPAGSKVNAGTVLSDYLESELSAEQARRESLERRGLAIVTVAGALTTLLLALPSALLRDRRVELSTSTRAAALAALAGFVLTVGAATSISLPRPTRLVSTDSLLDVAQESWWHTGDEVLQRIFGTRAEQLRQDQRANDRRGLLLVVASLCLALAIGALAVLAALLILSSSAS
jgi:hypothetical protein